MAGALEPMEYVEDWIEARIDTAADAEGRSRLRAQAYTLTRTGIDAGGPYCCGTTSMWHRPWCLSGPRHHRASQQEKENTE